MPIQKILKLFACLLLLPLTTQSQNDISLASIAHKAIVTNQVHKDITDSHNNVRKATQGTNNTITDSLQIDFNSPTDTIVIVPSYAVISIRATTSYPVLLSLYNETSTGDLILLNQLRDTILSYPFQTGVTGEGRIRIVASDSTGRQKEDSFYYVITAPPVIQDVPAKIKDGISYRNTGNVILSLFLPFKKNVYVIGDFNNWMPTNDYQMKKTTDGNRYWLEITGLTAGKEYAFQYLVDGKLRIGDPYTDKILDLHDQFINSSANEVYPDLKPYPLGRTTGTVSILQTNQQPYTWQATTFVRPPKENLVIYKLLIRDFIGTHSYKTLADTLSYLKKLGVNAIELMPVTEFAGNESTGYDPMYYFAPDKYYGTKNDLKAFIDKAHQMGMAVVLDMVLNNAGHEFPYVKAYRDGNQPATDNPYFNQQATHPSSSFFDFNHESTATQALVDTISVYWLQEYKVDGFRFHLSKGFTQKNTGNDVSAWNAKDDSRIAIWKRIYDKITTYDKSAYVILDHSGVNEEEKILADYGMMLQGSMQPNYKEAALGFDNSKAELNLVSYKQRNWNHPHLIAYIESHNEERLMFEQQRSSNVHTAANYNTKTLSTALDRMKLLSAFYFTVPGPKMIWQFGELGYDLSLNCCPDGSVSNECREANKPLKWDYIHDANRRKLYKVYAALIKLKTTQPAFQSTDFTVDASGPTKHIAIKHSSMQVYVIGNFGIDTVSAYTKFTSTGKWYDYFNGDSISVVHMDEKILLQPGEFHIFTTTRSSMSENGIVPNWRYTLSHFVPNAITDNLFNTQTSIYPNPNAGKMAVKIDNTSQHTIILNLYDLRGKLLQTLQLRKWQPILRYDMNFERLPMGVYLLEIIDGNKKAVKKVYKN